MAEIAAMRQQANDATKLVETGRANGWITPENYAELTSIISSYRMQIVNKLRWTDRKDRES